MSNADQPIRWAARVAPHKIRQLYATDARGIVDEEMIDDVGYAIFARCDSIRAVTAAHSGRAKCHGCGAIIQHAWKKDEPMVCGECGWQTTWGEYLTSYQRKQLHGGAAFPAFVQFHERWLAARTPRDKMLLIDWLIHALHTNDLIPWVRPAAVNVIDAKIRPVSALLEELAYGDLSTPGLGAAHDAWKQNIEKSKEAMKEYHAERREAQK